MNEFIEGTYVNAAGIRNYRLYVAASGDAEAAPLFVMLHGCDQNAVDFAAGTRMNELADECRGVVLYPEQCRLVNPLGCWNWHDANHQSADHGEPALIAGMTRQVAAERNIDSSRIYVAGMSAGGAMAVILGQEYPDLYAAVGVHSGVPSGVASDLVSALRAMAHGPVAVESAPARARTHRRRAVPTIVFHGDMDTVVHPSNGEAVHVQALRPTRRAAASMAPVPDRSNRTHGLEAPGSRAFTRTLETYDGVPGAELWMVHGGGHAWTGGSPEGTHTDAVGPDASREMVRFFLQQRLDAGMPRH
ncbi:MAG: PHB depolymerase family esterase [Casimicrobiaceae bacterium]